MFYRSHKKIAALRGLAHWSAVVYVLAAIASTVSAAERYAFLVSVRHYDQRELTSLNFTENDIADLAQALLDAGYRKEHVVLMTQIRAATEPRFSPVAANIRQELTLLLGELAAEDSLVVAFSGHGVQFANEKDSYFCPADAKLTDRQTLVSLGEIYGEIEDCKAGMKVLLVDACRNDPQSNLSKAAQKPVDLETVTHRQSVAPPGGINAFFSCSAGQQSYEHPDLKHGIFFHYVVQGLTGAADLDKDREVSLAELEQYVVKQVQTFARTELGAAQTPERRGEARGLLTLAALKRSSGAGPGASGAVKKLAAAAASVSKPRPQPYIGRAVPPPPTPATLVDVTLVNNMGKTMKVELTAQGAPNTERDIPGYASRQVKLDLDRVYHAQVSLDAPSPVTIVGQPRAPAFHPHGWFKLNPKVTRSFDVDKMAQANRSAYGSSPDLPNNGRRRN